MADIKDILVDRGSKYGNFATQGELAQSLKQTCWNNEGWDKLEADQREAIEMIQHKISRILNGNPNYADSWDDIAGYATLISQRLNSPKAPQKTVKTS